MRTTIQAITVMLALCASMNSSRAGEPASEPQRRPEAVGDQVIFYYDARADFTTFVNLRNTSGSAVTVSLLFYGPTFSTPFSQAVTLAAGALTIVDVGALRGDGLAAQPGVALATAVDLTGRPIVTRALTGNFTVANLLTGSAFGAAGAARVAIEDGDEIPSLGTVIDGDDVRLRPIRSSTAVLAAYYDPATLAPVANSGNQLVFLNFEDDYEPTYGATIGSTTWNVTTTRANGAGIGSTTFVANGVTVTDLASVAGAGVNGAAGSMTFVAESENAGLTRLVYFTESLGTFGTGYLLPPLPAE